MTTVTNAGVTQVAVLACLLFLRCCNEDIGAIQLYRPVADTLDQRKILRILEWTIFLAVLNDRFGLGHADPIQFGRNRLGIRGIDVDGPRKCPHWQTGYE